MHELTDQSITVPKDSAPTRLAILTAAQQTLKRGGLHEFSIAAVARVAGVAKGLVLYHFESRRRLLRRCAEEIAAERERRLEAALRSGGGAQGIDAGWEELVRQEEDGTARAWLGMCAAGLVSAATADGDFERRARHAILDGCTAALAADAPARELRDAYYALWLAMLELSDPGSAGGE